MDKFEPHMKGHAGDGQDQPIGAPAPVRRDRVALSVPRAVSAFKG